MEHNKEPRNRPIHIQSGDLQQGCQEYTMWKIWKNLISTSKRMKFDPSLSSYTQKLTKLC